MRVVANGLAVALTALVLAWVLDLFRAVGIVIYTEQFLALALALAMPLTFIHVPARRGQVRGETVPWHDLLAAALSAAGSIYVALRFPQMSDLVYMPPWHGTLIAAGMCLLLLEGLRRTTGYGLVAVTLGIVGLILLGHWLPGTLQGREVPIDRLTYFLFWDPSAIFGPAMKIVVTLVVAFVFFGNVLFKSGGSVFFTDLAMALMGRLRGGPAKIAILASSLFGTISGSVVANIVTTGVVTIPLMRDGGFRRHHAGAIEAVASTGGQLMPPIIGVAAFLMAEFLQVPYAHVVLAAIIPSVLFYVALFTQVDLEAARMDIKAVEASRIPRISTVLKEGWFFLLPFAVLIYALFWLNYEPEAAALLAAGTVLICVFVFGFRGQRPKLIDLYAMLRDTGTSVLELFMIGAAAGVVMAGLSYSGLGFGLSLSLVHLAAGSVMLLLVLAGCACIVLGMGMPTVGVYILLATLVAPALIEMDIPPMAAHMFIMYYGMLSMITPPVAIGAFTAANIAGAGGMQTALAACRFGWLAFVVPFLFVFSGTLLMSGDPIAIVIDFFAAVAGICLVTVAMMGYALGPIGLAWRLYCAAAGIFLIVPLSLFAGARWINGLGAAMAVLVVFRELALRRKVQARPA